MVEPKPFASLTSGLLARKGAATPAMRRPSLTDIGTSLSADFQDDLGWNDMQGDHAPVETRPMGLTPMAATVEGLGPVSEPAVVTEQKALLQKVKAMVSSITDTRAAQAGSRTRKAAFTLRLDTDRHLRLRLACAVQNRSAQQVVTDALDQFLNGLPDIDRLAEHLPRDRGQR